MQTQRPLQSGYQYRTQPTYTAAEAYYQKSAASLAHDIQAMSGWGTFGAAGGGVTPGMGCVLGKNAYVSRLKNGSVGGGRYCGRYWSIGTCTLSPPT